MSDVLACAERGISAPPEVVFNTAIDPARVAAWLPAPLWDAGVRWSAEPRPDLCATWEADGQDGWSASLQVREVDAGGAVVRLELDADTPPPARLAEIADKSLVSLAREVADNLTAG